MIVTVQPKRLFIECPQPVNDGQWHTAYIKRRANFIEAYFDDCTHKPGLCTLFLFIRLMIWRDIHSLGRRKLQENKMQD